MGSTPSSYEPLDSFDERERSVLAALDAVYDHCGKSEELTRLQTIVRQHLLVQRNQQRALANANLHAAELMVELERLNEELRTKNAKLIEQRDLERRLASRIQTSMLPSEFDIPGLEIAARMVAAEDVGGDYYDAIAIEGGGWIGIGDVSGHGFDAGMLMLLAQSAVSALVRAEPSAPPSRVVGALNTTFFEAVRRRLRQDDFMTMTLFRYWRDGRIQFAGAHESIIVWRARTGRCESIDTPGTWMGLQCDVSSIIADRSFALDDGDLLVLHTDGVTEAHDESDALFGIDRLRGEIELTDVQEPAATVVERIIGKVNDWSPRLKDDVSLLVARYAAPR